MPPAWTSLADDSPDITGRRTDALAVLRVTVETARQQADLLCEQLARADNRADKAEAQAQALAADLERAMGDIRALQEATTRARAAALEAHDAAEELRRADAARRSLRLLARLRAAWRGK